MKWEDLLIDTGGRTWSPIAEKVPTWKSVAKGCRKSQLRDKNW